MADIQTIYSILLARGYQDTLFSKLSGARKKEKGGRETKADCPLCHKEGHFSYSRDKPVWRCWSCGEAGDWLSFMQKASGYDFQTALQELAAAAGVELSPYSKERYQAYTRRADILETTQEYLVEALSSAPGQPVIDYLAQRGYSFDDIEGMELGAYTDRLALKQLLTGKGYTEKEIRDSGLLAPGWGEDYKLTLLWRDASGRATGIVGRPLILSDEELKARGLTKYRYSDGLQKDAGLIGFSTSRGSKQIVILEGVLDALYLNYKGFKSVAIGGTSISATQLQALEATGTKELLLALDMDEAGQKATEKMLKSLADSSLRAYVVSLPEGYKDADELVRSQGDGAFKDALAKAERWTSWIARRIVSKYDKATDRGMDAALEEALEVYSGLEDKIQARAFMDSLRQSSGLEEEELASRLSKASQTASIRRAQAILDGYIHSIQQKSLIGDISGAEDEMTKALREVKAGRGLELPEAYLLEDYIADVLATSPALSTGYSKLDAVARIPMGALTIIAARTRHGKTTFQLNLLANLLKAYPDKSFYYYSYEESRKAIVTKLIMILAGVVLNRETNYEAYINYMQSKRGTNNKIEAAYQEYQRLSTEGRLLISDGMYPAEDLSSIIGLLAKEGRTGAVIIDYIQRIPLARPSQGQRYLDIKLVSSLLLEQAVRMDIPIILGAQLRRDIPGSKPRLESLRESGDIEQDANLILGLYTAAMEEMEKEDYKAPAKPAAEVDMEVSILKNRGGISARSYILTFNQPVLRITDKAGGLY